MEIPLENTSYDMEIPVEDGWGYPPVVYPPVVYYDNCPPRRSDNSPPRRSVASRFRRWIGSPFRQAASKPCDASPTSQIRAFTPQQLKKATKYYHEDYKLGQGGFGAVYKQGALPDGQEIAVKKLSDPSRKHGNSQFEAEINTISSVRHRNLIRLLGYCIDGDNKYLVYEYLNNLSLDKHLFANEGRRMSTLSWHTRQKIIQGTANGLSYLHHDLNDRIVHRDIKAANILLDTALEAKIADFGLARQYSCEQTHHSTAVAGTIGYLAPEILNNGQVTQRSDTYSFGVVALEILSGRRVIEASLPSERRNLLNWAWELHEGHRHTDLMDPLIKGEYTEEEVRDFIWLALMCTQTTPEERPTMRDVVSILERKKERCVIGTPSKPDYEYPPQFQTNYYRPLNTMDLTDSCEVYRPSNDDVHCLVF